MTACTHVNKKLAFYLKKNIILKYSNSYVMFIGIKTLMRKPNLDIKEYPPIPPEDRYKLVRESIRNWIFAGGTWSELEASGLDSATIARIAKWPHKKGTKKPSQETLEALIKVKDIIPGFPSIKFGIEAEKNEAKDNQTIIKMLENKAFNHYFEAEKLIKAIVEIDSFNDLKSLQGCLAHAENLISLLKRLDQTQKARQDQEANRGPASDRAANNR